MLFPYLPRFRRSPLYNPVAFRNIIEAGDDQAVTVLAEVTLSPSLGYRRSFAMRVPPVSQTFDSNLERCPDCGLQLPAQTIPRHPYLGASASSWALYTEVLAREYSEPLLMKSVHRLTVDAYSAQHPGKAERRTIQSVWVHLAGLYLTIEQGLAHDFARRIIGALTQEASGMAWLIPPPQLGDCTVVRVAKAQSNAEHEEAVRLWARDVWGAWKPHHSAIKSMVSRLTSTMPHQ
jgi:hypothetical protein